MLYHNKAKKILKIEIKIIIPVRDVVMDFISLFNKHLYSIS